MTPDKSQKEMRAAISKLTPKEIGLMERCMDGRDFASRVTILLAAAAGFLIGMMIR